MSSTDRKRSRILSFLLVLATVVSLVTPALAAASRGKAAITVNALPSVVTAKEGKTVSVKVTASSSTGASLKYRWYFSEAGSSTEHKSSITGSTYRVTMNEERSGRKVYCVVSDSKGNSAKTNTATLSLSVPSVPVITKQPQNTSAVLGKNAQISVSAVGELPLKYVWYYAPANSGKFTKSFVNTSTYSVNMRQSRSGRRAYCVITDRNGDSVVSNTVTLSMHAPVSIQKQPGNTVAAEGEIARVSVKASGAGTLTYQWYIRNPGSKKFSKSSVTGPTYSMRMSAAADGRQVYCVISDQYGQKATTLPAVLSLCRDHRFGEETPMGKNSSGYVFEKTCRQCGQQEYKTYDSLLTFVDDDGKMQAMLHWENIIDATGIKMTAALIGSKITDKTDYDCWWAYAGWDLLERMQDKGVDFVHHTYSHKRLTTFTEEELHRDFKKNKAALKAYGIKSNILVYPFNDHNKLVDSVAAQYFDAAFCGENRIITDIEADPYGLTRVNINDSSSQKVITFDQSEVVTCNGVKELKTLKAEMRTALKNKGWLVCLSHAYDSPSGKYYFDEECEQTIIDFCKYVQSLGNVKIVTLTEGLAAAAELPD